MKCEVIFTNAAETQALRIFDYIFFKLENPQAALNFQRDMQETVKRLTVVANGLKLCEDPKLQKLNYRTIHLKHHSYFMLYKVIDNQAFIIGIYHNLQDYESVIT